MAEHGVLGTSGEGRSGRRVPGAGILAVLAVLGLMAVVVGLGSAAEAATTPGTSLIRQDNTFYAYVGAGESLAASFSKVVPAGGATDVTITVERPGGTNLSCTIAAGAANGTACTWPLLTAPNPGIWRITFDVAGGTTNRTNWSIVVRDGTTPIPGRVYSEQYHMTQSLTDNANDGRTNVDLWYQSELGYTYAATYGNFMGVDSVFRADATGVRADGGCEPAYRSINLQGPNIDPGFSWPALGECGDPYKIFFEAPAADLPESATRWDGATEWVVPPIVMPEVTNLVFEPDGGTVQSGELTFDVQDFNGTLDVLIDGNGDGDYDDPEDRRIPTFSEGGEVTVPFDGLDGLGDPIPHTRAISARVDLDRTAEIHFTMVDAEVRGAGLQVEVLNGPTAGDRTIYWDDSPFAGQNATRCGTPPTPLDGTAGIDSTGGVHRWDTLPTAIADCPGTNPGVNGPYGDARTIDDWAFVPVDAAAEVDIQARELAPADLAVEKTGPITVAPEGEISWTITVTNVGTTPSTGHTVIDAIPSGVTDVASPDSGCTVNSVYVQCGSSPLEPGESVSYTITGTAPTGAGTIIDNVVEVIGVEEDDNPDNDVDEHQTEVVDNGIPLVASVPAGLIGLVLTAGGVLLLQRRRRMSVRVTS